MAFDIKVFFENGTDFWQFGENCLNWHLGLMRRVCFDSCVLLASSWKKWRIKSISRHINRATIYGQQLSHCNIFPFIYCLPKIMENFLFFFLYLFSLLLVPDILLPREFFMWDYYSCSYWVYIRMWNEYPFSSICLLCFLLKSTWKEFLISIWLLVVIEELWNSFFNWRQSNFVEKFINLILSGTFESFLRISLEKTKFWMIWFTIKGLYIARTCFFCRFWAFHNQKLPP